jgi:hypothetical protein
VRVCIGVLLIAVVGALGFGCGKESSLEGKVVNGRKQPLAGVSVIATMVLPVKGYEQSVATTDTHGFFRFPKVFPASEYRITAFKGKNASSDAVMVKSGPKGQTITAPQPVEIRFMLSKDGVAVSDTRTGLMWTRDADILKQRIDLDQAKLWVTHLDIGGHRDWRVPRREDLLELAKSGVERPAESLNGGAFYNVKSGSYWSITTHENNPEFAWWVVDMYSGGEFNLNKSDRSYVWPVRSEE